MRSKFLILFFLGMAIFGFFFTISVLKKQDNDLRSNFIFQAQIIAGALNKDRISVLSCDRSETNNPVYIRLKDQFIKTHKVFNACQYIYFLKLKDGKPVFLVDSMPVGSTQESLPGDNFLEAPSILADVFNNNEEVIAGPHKNKSVDCISVFYPVLTEGKVLGVLGIDVDYNLWKKYSIDTAKTLLIFLVLLLISTVTAILIIIWRDNLPEQVRLQRLYRHLDGGFSLILGLISIGVIYSGLSIGNYLLLKETFIRLGLNKAQNFLNSINDLRDIQLQGLIHYFEGCEFVTSNEFKTYVKFILERKKVSAIGMLSVNTAAITNETVLDPNVLTRDANDFPGGSTERRQWPYDVGSNQVSRVIYVEPMEEFGSLVGFDLFAVPEFKQAISSLCLNKLPVAVGPLNFAVNQIPGLERGIFLFMPFELPDQKGALVDGIVFCIIDIEKTLAGLRRSLTGYKPVFDFSIFKVTNSGFVRLCGSDVLGNSDGFNSFLQGFKIGDRFCVPFINNSFGEVFVLAVKEAAGFKDSYSMNLWGTSLIPGILFVILFALLVDILTNHNFRLRRMVKIQTDDLERAASLFKTTIYSIGDGVITTDTSGRIMQMNSVAEMLTGWKEKDAVSQQITDVFKIVNEETRASVSNPVLRALSEGLVVGLANHTLLLSRDGREIPIADSAAPIRDAKGNIYGVVLVFRDQSHERQLQRELINSRRFLRLVLDTIPSRVFWKDLNLKYLGCNKPFYQDAGLSSENEIIGKDDYMMGWRNEAERYRADDLEVIRTGIPRIGYEEPQTTPKGDKIWLRTSKIPLKDEKGTIIGVLGTYEEITQSKKALEEKAKLQLQLLQAQKLESVGRLAGGVAHDFNNKLQVIIGNTALAISDVEPGSSVYNCLEQIHSAALQAADLVKKLLGFARKQVIKPVVLDINTTVSTTISMLRSTLPESIDLLWTPGVNLWKVEMDPVQLDQVITNLVINAKDAITSGKGRITIKTQNVILDDEYCKKHQDIVPGRYVELSIIDNGCGMSRDVLDHLFEPFFTTKDPSRGTGLGLSTVYGIVKQNKGSISVYSEIGKGTAIKIYLPALEEKEEEIKPIKTFVKSKLESGSETILVVEDNEMVLTSVRTILQRLGYKTIFTTNAKDALEIIQKYNQKIDLLMTDVVMPDMNGKELYQEAKKICPGLKVLFVSGYAAEILEEDGFTGGHISFLSKPFSDETLANAIRNALES